MKPRLGSPRSARAAAVYTIRRAASSFIAISASMNCTAWKSAMALPNCLRSLTYAIAASSAPCAMPTACAPIVGLVWSRVASAVLKPVPGSPMIRSPGMRQSSKYNSVVGEPLMPILCSLAPTAKPGSSLCTTNAEMPLAPLSGSVTAITVYQVEWPPLEIQHLAPLSTHSSPSSRALVRIDPASLPASRSDSAYDATASPEAIVGSTCFLSSSEPRNSRPMVPSLLQIGISDDDAHTRATSSMTMQAATESPPCPPYSSGMWIAANPDEVSAASASSVYRAFSSTSAAYGAISFSHRSRSTERSSLCSSASLKASNDGLPMAMATPCYSP